MFTTETETTTTHNHLESLLGETETMSVSKKTWCPLHIFHTSTHRVPCRVHGATNGAEESDDNEKKGVIFS
jgi:hypothetical protein